MVDRSQAGDTLDILLEAKEPGQYELVVKLTKAVDYAVVQLELDGKTVGPQIDLYNQGVIPWTISLGVHQLTAGKHTLTVRIVGANPNAVKSYMFGIDQIILNRQPRP